MNLLHLLLLLLLLLPVLLLLVIGVWNADGSSKSEVSTDATTVHIATLGLFDAPV
jgi:hypothetical protein